MEKDQEIFDLIEREHQRQLKGMELIASENFVSEEVMNAMGSYLTNKYAEGLPGKRYYGGCQVVDIVENLAIERVKKVFGAEYANVQPHSGAQANAAVLLAVLKPGDTFMGLNLDHGGHLSHGSHVNTSGILYRPIGYNLNKETGRVDYDEMEKLALENKPKLIIGGGSAYSREWDYARMRKIAPSCPPPWMNGGSGREISVPAPRTSPVSAALPPPARKPMPQPILPIWRSFGTSAVKSFSRFPASFSSESRTRRTS